MNRIENLSGPENAYVFSVGGSALFEKPSFWRNIRALISLNFGEDYNPVQYDKLLVAGLMGMTCELISQNSKLVMITGGGRVARHRITDTMKVAKYIMKDQSYYFQNEETSEQQDHVGLTTSNLNAAQLLAIAKLAQLPSYWYGQGLFGKAYRGKLGLRGGTMPRRTTDMVASEIGAAEAASFVINIGVKGIHPLKNNGKLNTRVIIPHLTTNEYLDMIEDTGHFPGKNVPFEREAAELAAEHGIGVILVGQDISNLKKLFAGKEFVGTVITPG